MGGLSVQSRITSYGPRSARAFAGVRASAIASTWIREFTLEETDRHREHGLDSMGKKKKKKRRAPDVGGDGYLMPPITKLFESAGS